MTAPPTSSAPLRPGGLLAAFTPPEREDPPIPVVFREAPGPARENRNPAAPSDATRRAGGGEESRPRSETPFSSRFPASRGSSPAAEGAGTLPLPNRRAVRPPPGGVRRKGALRTTPGRGSSAPEGRVRRNLLWPQTAPPRGRGRDSPDSIRPSATPRGTRRPAASVRRARVFRIPTADSWTPARFPSIRPGTTGAPTLRRWCAASV